MKRLLLRSAFLLTKALCALSFVIMCYLFAALLGGIHIDTRSASTKPHNTVQIGLLQGPIHYDLLLPLSASTREHFAWLADAGFSIDHAIAEWMIVGWGAKDFYTSTGAYSDVSAKSAIRGIIGDQSVMRVDLAGPIPDDAPVRWLTLYATQYDTLLTAITNTFANEATTPALNIRGFNAEDMFFDAKGRFNIFQTCNVWIGKMMRTAGISFGRWTPTPFAVTLSHRLGAN